MKCGRWMWAVTATSGVLLGTVGACSDDGGDPIGGSGDGGDASHGADANGAANNMGGDDRGGTAGSDGEPAGATFGGSAGSSDSGGAGGEDPAAGGAAGAGMAGAGAGAGGLAGEGGAGPDPVVWQLGACTPRGLSKDGNVVLADEGLWTAASGWQPLPDLAGGAVANQPRALSPDGKVVFGNSGSTLGDEMYRWTAAGGIQGLGKTYVPFSASFDGSVVVGWSNANVEEDFANPFRWTSTGSFTDLGSFDPSSSTTNFIDAHLNEAGTHAEFSYDRDRARWTLADGLDVVSSNLRVSAMSADASKLAIFYGHSGGYIGATGACIPEPNEPPLMSPNCSATGGDIWVVVLDMDDSGDRGVGFQLNDDNEYIAFYWSADGGIQRLDAVLPEDIKSYPNAEAEEWFAESYPPRPYLSGDGQTVLGKAANDQCFVATITPPT